MKVEYKNLYTHFVFTTLRREPLIDPKNRERIEKYVTGIVKNQECQLYAIYANPEHMHLLVSRSQNRSMKVKGKHKVQKQFQILNRINRRSA